MCIPDLSSQRRKRDNLVAMPLFLYRSPDGVEEVRGRNSGGIKTRKNACDRLCRNAERESNQIMRSITEWLKCSARVAHVPIILDVRRK